MTNKPRSEQVLAAVRRADAAAKRAKRAVEAARVTRDAAISAAMGEGWTSVEIGEVLGIPDHAVRQLTYMRKTGRPGERRNPEPA